MKFPDFSLTGKVETHFPGFLLFPDFVGILYRDLMINRGVSFILKWWTGGAEVSPWSRGLEFWAKGGGTIIRFFDWYVTLAKSPPPCHLSGLLQPKMTPCGSIYTQTCPLKRYEIQFHLRMTAPFRHFSIIQPLQGWLGRKYKSTPRCVINFICYSPTLQLAGILRWQDVLWFLTSWVCPSWELSSWYVTLSFSLQPAGSIPAGKSHPIGKIHCSNWKIFT